MGPLGCTSRTYSVLVVNTGSTSTKVAVFSGCKLVCSDNIQHPPDELAQYARISDQLEYRKDMVLKSIEANNIVLDGIDAVISRGGALKPVPGGVYSCFLFTSYAADENRGGIRGWVPNSITSNTSTAPVTSPTTHLN